MNLIKPVLSKTTGLYQKYAFILLLLLFSSAASGSGMKLKLDSIVSPGASKEIFYYDAEGRACEKIYQLAQKPQGWRSSGKECRTYNADGQYAEVLTYEYDVDADAWKEAYRNVYSYDGGHLKEIMFYYWDGQTNDWARYQKENYAYTAGRALKQMERFYMAHTGWQNSIKEEYLYEDNGALASKINYTGTWAGGWEEDSKNVYAYNEAGSLISDIYLAGPDQEEDKRTEYIYDADGRFSSYIVKYAASADAEKYEFIFDYDCPVSNLWVDNEYKWSCMLAGRTDNLWDSKEQLWLEVQHYEYYYSAAAATGSLHAAVESCMVYPSCFSSAINICSEGAAVFSLYSASGQQLLVQETAGHTAVPAHHIPPGVYFYQLASGKNKYSGRLIKNN